MGSFINTLFSKTFSTHPYVFLFVILCVGISTGHSYRVFAQEAVVKTKFTEISAAIDVKLNDVGQQVVDLETALAGKIEDIDSRLTSFERTMKTQFAQQSIRQINSRVYDLTELVSSGKANRRDHNQLKDLKDDLRVETDLLDELRDHHKND